MLLVVIKQGNQGIYNLFFGWHQASKGNTHYKNIPGYVGRLSSTVYLFEEVKEVIEVLYYYVQKRRGELRIFRVGEPLEYVELGELHRKCPSFKDLKTASKEGASASPYLFQ